MPRLVRSVSAGNFSPPPSVDSAILAITDISRTFFKHLDEKHFFELLHIGFGSKRKQLGSNLSKHYDKEVALRALEASGISPQARAEDLTLEQWGALARALSDYNV